MVDVLLILDGASEPLGPEPTSLERARTPALDSLAAHGRLGRLRTVAPGLSPGSESAIPALLGWTPPGPVDRGALEAAARGLDPDAGERAWRVDVMSRSGARPGAKVVRSMATSLESLLPDHRVQEIGGHRLLVTGTEPLPLRVCAPGLQVWPSGIVPPRVLDHSTVMVAASGAAVGVAKLLGARTVIPDGATGGLDTDLRAKADAAVAAIEAGARRVVVHIAAPDEAAHDRDATGKVAAIERIDEDLIVALAGAVEVAGGTLRVCPDHGCDPATGKHDGAPVPVLEWAPGASVSAGRLTERDVANLPAELPEAAS